MRCAARTQSVNRSPEGQTTPLTQRQLYDGLKVKAREPGEFVPLIEHCRVLSENKTGLLREVKFRGKPEPVQERVEFFEPTSIHFTMVSPEGETVGHVTNIISTTSDDEVLLTFNFAIGRNGEEDDAEADEHAKAIVGGADTAIGQTISIVRRLVKEGKL